MKNILVTALMLFSLNAMASTESSKITLTGDSTRGYILEVIQVPSTYSWPDYTDIWLTYTRYKTTNPTSPAKITFQDTNVDEMADWYLVPDGAEFSALTIADGTFKPFANYYSNPNLPYTSLGSSLNLGQRGESDVYSLSGIFYLGVNTGVHDDSLPWGSPLDNQRTAFGWAKFFFGPTGIRLLDSAMTYDSAGIYIGTTTTIPIPESDTYVMLFAGLSVFGFIARRKQA